MYEHGGDIYSHIGCLDFSANVNPLGTPDAVLAALKRSVSLCGVYPDPRMQRLREKIAAANGVRAEHVICGNGAAELIFQLAAARRPRRALLPVPGFYEYERALAFYGCGIARYPLKMENGFLPGDDFIGQIDGSVDAVFLCNPNNPTGTFLDTGWMERLLRRCIRTGTLLVVDECFLPLTGEEGRRSLARHVPDLPQIFVLRAFTKTFALPGIRIGYGLCSDQKLLARMREGSQPWNVSLPAQMAGCAAADEKDFIKETNIYLKKEKDYLIPALAAEGLVIYGSAANYIFFAGPKTLWERLLACGILLRDCSNYCGLEKGFYRAAIRRHEDNVRLVAAVRRCRSESDGGKAARQDGEQDVSAGKPDGDVGASADSGEVLA